MPGLREADCSEGWREAGEAWGYREGGEITEPGHRDMVSSHRSSRPWIVIESRY